MNYCSLCGAPWIGAHTCSGSETVRVNARGTVVPSAAEATLAALRAWLEGEKKAAAFQADREMRTAHEVSGAYTRGRVRALDAVLLWLDARERGGRGEG